MNPAPWLWAHLQTALLLAALAAWLAPRLGWRRGGALLLLAWLPLGQLDLTARLVPYTGLLSLPGLALLAQVSLRRWFGWELLSDPDRRALWLSLALTAAFLYPLALGLGPWDPYGWGYGGPWLALALSLMAAGHWWMGRHRLAVLLLAVIWAWLLRLGESDNAWDYLIDAWVAMAALVQLGLRRRPHAERMGD